MEDDNHFSATSMSKMKAAILPPGWHIICGVYWRADGDDNFADFIKVTGFWGLGGYLINKDGANRILKEVQERKIDGQIDAYLSRMAQQDKLAIYAAKTQWFECLRNESNIQTEVRPLPGEDPFVFDGYRV
jgi:hypothetical protein